MRRSRLAIRSAVATGAAIPSVSIIKDGAFSAENHGDGPDDAVELRAASDHMLRLGRLARFVSEGEVPSGCLGTIRKGPRRSSPGEVLPSGDLVVRFLVGGVLALPG